MDHMEGFFGNINKEVQDFNFSNELIIFTTCAWLLFPLLEYTLISCIRWLPLN
jgi:hypothetical protein